MSPDPDRSADLDPRTRRLRQAAVRGRMPVSQAARG